MIYLRTLYDLTNRVVADGSWHFLSFDWRDEIDDDVIADSTNLVVNGIGVGAQHWLDDCPTSQNAADVYTLSQIAS